VPTAQTERFAAHKHKNSHDAGGQPHFSVGRQRLGTDGTKLVMFHKLGQVAAQEWSFCRTETVSLLLTRMVMMITILVRMALFQHKNSHFSARKLLI
jgi:hypothetical protein